MRLTVIAKPYAPQSAVSNPRALSGANAERQLAHYLSRHFADDEEVHVLHDLRLRDPEQPEQTGEAGTCQVDHLVIHRWGTFIVESKSVTTEVRVRPDDSDGDEWTRMRNGAERGMPSPIRQAKRQGEFLRTYLIRHRAELLGKFPLGMRTFGKAVTGSDQRGFRNLPVQLIVAISDSGRIRRLDGWQEPEHPFRVFVTKADLVAEKIADELTRHRKGASLLHNPLTIGSYGMWAMSADEAGAVAAFLAEHHSERPSSNGEPRRSLQPRGPAKHRSTASEDVTPACKYCAGSDITARSGKYGYYWQCRGCGKNTSMPTICSACGAIGHRGRKVRIRKGGANYFRDCQECRVPALGTNLDRGVARNGQ